MNVTQKIANKRLRDIQKEIPINRKKKRNNAFTEKKSHEIATVSKIIMFRNQVSRQFSNQTLK